MSSQAPSCRCYVDQSTIAWQAISASLGVPVLMQGEYRNPFSFMDEFDCWFEFERRRHFGGESTYRIIRDMLADDLPRAARSLDTNYTALKATADAHYGRMPLTSRSFTRITS